MGIYCIALLVTKADQPDITTLKKEITILHVISFSNKARQSILVRSGCALLLRIGFRITDDFVFKRACYLRLFGSNVA